MGKKLFTIIIVFSILLSSSPIIAENITQINKNYTINEELKLENNSKNKINKHISNSTIYDLLIIAPSRFTFFLQPFINHKNNKMDIKTILKPTNQIYKEYEGIDKAEKVKKFIYWAKNNWNISYVLLVGGRVRQSFRWHVPVRYSHIDYHLDEEGIYNETSFLSDLYFSDIYKEDKVTFEDWDSNNNGVFGEWTWSYNQSSGEYDILKNKDEIDLTPDVSVGRLPCRNIFEVYRVTKKIIAYENDNQKGDWFKNMILVGGDTVPPPDGTSGIYEGIIETMLALSYMKPLGFSFKKLWVNTSEFNGRQDVIDAVNEGAGFFYLTGHGNPAAWSTYPADSDDYLINGLFVWDTKKLCNKEKLPICIIGGCHNSQFDVTVRNLLKNPLNSLIYGSFIRECWSWRLVNKRGGGAIACIGNTAIGYGEEGYDTVAATDGWISTRFFKVYADHVNYSAEKPILGDIHSSTIGEYIENFDMTKNELHSKTVQQWALIGDPSMRIG